MTSPKKPKSKTQAKQELAIVVRKPTPPAKQKPKVKDTRITADAEGKLNIPTATFEKLTRAFVASRNSKGACEDRVSVLFGQLASALPVSNGAPNSSIALNVALESVDSLKPRDAFEVLLCSQMVALHHQAMEYMRLAVTQTQGHDGVLRGPGDDSIDRNVNRASKLLRTFAALAETLRSKRNGGQQRVVVKHVHVHSGGQAIVGSVTRGGGDAKENRE